MKRRKPNDIVVVDGEDSRSILHWLIAHFASHPGWVTLITFAAAGLVTWIVLWADDRLTLTDAVTMLAALWALFFAVMIYLLSAEDTDHILQQITDLQGQLSMALTSPDQTDADAAEEPVPTPPAPVETTPSTTPPIVEPMPTPPDAGAERPTVVPEVRPGRDRPHGWQPQILTTKDQITQTVPDTFLEGWSQGTGLTMDSITVAWTRDPHGRQWVLETDNAKWLVFSRGSNGVTLVPLRDDDSRRTSSERRQESEQREEQRRQANTERTTLQHSQRDARRQQRQESRDGREATAKDDKTPDQDSDHVGAESLRTPSSPDA